MTQMRNKKPKDWISMVLEDLQKLNLSISLEELRQMKKSKLKQTLNRLVKGKKLKELVKKKESHSKVKHIKHTALEMQRYFKAGGFKMNQEEVQTFF